MISQSNQATLTAGHTFRDKHLALYGACVPAYGSVTPNILGLIVTPSIPTPTSIQSPGRHYTPLYQQKLTAKPTAYPLRLRVPGRRGSLH
ncbi:uncharacterized protein BT62DRAFT_933012 [Guyanagaster necrorhizus]|uniref:Uncharacterized protein n=1 Tax=Guyanagaster necrorhizus TaxID=856835 RepID=A0A9P8ARH6_9AGAR|nr:uncharacterized protein BT62DRAFT_933012 [Guyanagaster necrorhizus MCA 3950]KAG7445204.1 hypothetical protein BT62DRAFT_933012 [Guyanagaster necrorhizus MCA 3950]